MKVLTEYIYNSIIKTIPSIGVFKDLVKAFVAVDHNILLNIFYDLDISGTPYELFKIYLRGIHTMS